MNRSDLFGRAAIAAWLTVMWVLLWGHISLANVVTGLALAGTLVVVFPPGDTNDDPMVIRPVAAVSFLVWFAWALVVTNVSVAREVLLPRSRSQIRTAVVAVPLQTQSGRLATIIANAITLTPGTLTIDARGRPAVLYVHVLSFESEEAVLAEMADLERRAVRAFGTTEERDRICGTGAGVGAGSARAADEESAT